MFSYPTNDEGLQALKQVPANHRFKDRFRQGGYIRKLEKDPWGTIINIKDLEIMVHLIFTARMVNRAVKVWIRILKIGNDQRFYTGYTYFTFILSLVAVTGITSLSYSTKTVSSLSDDFYRTTLAENVIIRSYFDESYLTNNLLSQREDFMGYPYVWNRKITVDPNQRSLNIEVEVTPKQQKNQPN